jgi:large conductance mechanosensitive channel
MLHPVICSTGWVGAPVAPGSGGSWQRVTLTQVKRSNSIGSYKFKPDAQGRRRLLMLRKLKALARGDLIVVAVGLLLALATFELVRATVENLIMPLVVLIFGQSEFPFLSFTIDNTDFAYGFVISAAISLGIVCLLVIPLWKAHQRYEGGPGTRDCPECLTPIPSAAKRCPECTAVVTEVSSSGSSGPSGG